MFKNKTNLGILNLMLVFSLFLTIFPISINAEEPTNLQDQSETTVTFLTQELQPLSYSQAQHAPIGSSLMTHEEISNIVADFQPVEGATYYLYKPANQQDPSFGPIAIPDPTQAGYRFVDWVNQDTEQPNSHQVSSTETTFIAKMMKDHPYVVNLYFRFENSTNSVAADTMTKTYQYHDTIQFDLPSKTSLNHLIPKITVQQQEMGTPVEAAKLAIESGIDVENNRFTIPLDDTFIQNMITANFVQVDENGQLVMDENGNYQFNIPISYTIEHDIQLTIHYMLEQLDGTYTEYENHEYTISGTTEVNLEELGAILNYDGYILSDEGQDIQSQYQLDPSETIVDLQLQYQREYYYITINTNGGNSVDTLSLKYGEPIPELPQAIKNGYRFNSYAWAYESDTTTYITKPQTMPAQNLVAKAIYDNDLTTFKINFYTENADNAEYSLVKTETISGHTNQTVGYTNGANLPDVAINEYVDVHYQKETRTDNRNYYISGSPFDEESVYFTLDETKISSSSIHGFTTISGDGTTEINVYYQRKQYTLNFYAYKNVGSTIYINTTKFSTNNQSPLATLNNATSQTTASNRFVYIQNNKISYGQPYTITAKYGQNISSLWPAMQAYRAINPPPSYSDDFMVNSQIYHAWTWIMPRESIYTNGKNNHAIQGVYATMSKDLILDAALPATPTNLVAYWGDIGREKIYNFHIFYEKVQGSDFQGEGVSILDYQNQYTTITKNDSLINRIDRYYEQRVEHYLTGAEKRFQNPPAIDRMELVGAYYNADNSSNDLYYFYKPIRYQITFDENNSNLALGTPENLRVRDFYIFDGKSIADTIVLPVGETIEGAPAQKFVSVNNQPYTFGGWYLDPQLTQPVSWQTFMAEDSLTVYAKWIAPTFTVKLVVPNGTVQSGLKQYVEDQGFTFVEQINGQNHEYLIGNIPEGTKASEMIGDYLVPNNLYGQSFNYWYYINNGVTTHYLFSENDVIIKDLTISVAWKQIANGKYGIRYLTQENPNNGLGSLQIDGKTYYRIEQDQIIQNVVTGSSVTLSLKSIQSYIPTHGALTRIIEKPFENQEPKTFFNFIYKKNTQPDASITYTVHYVRNTGVNYGTSPLPSGVQTLRSDKVVTVKLSELTSTNVEENAIVISGYTPRDSWTSHFTITDQSEHNHFYIYYNQNYSTAKVKVIYRVQDRYGKYPQQSFSTILTLPIGMNLANNDVIDHDRGYIQDEQLLEQIQENFVGRSMDLSLSTQYIIVANEQNTVERPIATNVMYIYLKNNTYQLTYDLSITQDLDHQVTWIDTDRFLTQQQTQYIQTIRYPYGATQPTSYPKRFGYTFAGWLDVNSQQVYQPEDLSQTGWYVEQGMSRNQTLLAQWTLKNKVTFVIDDLLWQDSRENFEFNQQSQQWTQYVSNTEKIVIPIDPIGDNLTFIGWSLKTNEQLTGLTLAQKSQQMFDFQTLVDHDITLYAIYEQIPKTALSLLVTDDLDDQPTLLTGAKYQLRKLQTVTYLDSMGNLQFSPVTNQQGYGVDPNFVIEQWTSQQGILRDAQTSDMLEPGLYQLTLIESAQGYDAPISQILLTISNAVEVTNVIPESSYIEVDKNVQDLRIILQLIPQISVQFTNVDEMVFQYDTPDYRWNPSSGLYEAIAGSGDYWSLEPDSQNVIYITNTSNAPIDLQVQAGVIYDQSYQRLQSQTSLMMDGQQMNIQPSIANIQPSQTLSVAVNIEGETRWSLPETPTNVGKLSLQIVPIH